MTVVVVGTMSMRSRIGAALMLAESALGNPNSSDAEVAAAARAAATRMLQVIGTLRPPTPDRFPRLPPAPQTKGPLSNREIDVAELLLLGMTYREIGARLFISAKTVEHHVARIRRRLDAGSRSELLSMLRALGITAGG